MLLCCGARGATLAHGSFHLLDAKALPEDKVKEASAQKQFEMLMQSANVPPSAFASMKVPDKVAALVKTPVQMIPSSQTATFSELLMYIGIFLMLIAYNLRRRLLL